MAIINIIQKNHFEKTDRLEIDNIFNFVDNEKGDLILILHNKVLLNGVWGECIPKKLLKYNDEAVFNSYLDEQWECGIAVSKKICELGLTYPGFFTYLLGHELAHAMICIQDLSLHIHYCLIQDYIREASKNRYTKSFQLPHEILCDKYGLFIAEKIYGRKQIENEIVDIIGKEIFRNNESLKVLLNYKGTDKLDRLKQELIDFSIPYKRELLDLWEKDLLECNNEGTVLLVSMVQDFESLFF